MFNTVTNTGLWVPGQTVTVSFWRWGNFERRNMQTPYVSYPDSHTFGKHFYHDLLLGYRSRGPDLCVNRILWTKAQIDALYATTADNKQDSLDYYSCLAVQNATDDWPDWPENLINYSDNYLDIVSITPTYNETCGLEIKSSVTETDYQRLYRFFSLKDDGSGDPWPVYWDEKMASDFAPVNSVEGYVYEGKVNDRIKHFHEKMVEIYGISWSGIDDLPITYSDLGTVHSESTITNQGRALPKHLVTVTFKVKDSFTMPTENLYLFAPSWDCWWDYYVSVFPIWGV